MIAVVDSGGANLSSVLFALERVGAQARLSADPDFIARSPKVILPGVGAAGSAMQTLRTRELIACLRELKQPVLGICLGMQILYERSEEGDAGCLGVIPGTVRRLRLAANLTLPHMGWNQVRGCDPRGSLLLPKEEEESYFYFVHSFAAPAGESVRAVAEYGGAVPAIVEWKNWLGTQFHPERSGRAGERLLARFAEL